MKLNESQLRNIIKESLNYLLNNEPLNESYEPNVDNGLYNGALMNLDDVRKSLPKNTPKDIWNLYQQLFDALERENENSSIENIPNGSIFVYIQKVDQHDKYYHQFIGKTFELNNVHRISKKEEYFLQVEGCDYVGEININGEIQPLPFEKRSINSKIPVSFEWIYAGYIRTGDKSNLQENK